MLNFERRRKGIAGLLTLSLVLSGLAKGGEGVLKDLVLTRSWNRCWRELWISNSTGA